jgi:hypothetical protein
MEKPKRLPLAPATLVELLDRTFKIYRENFMSFVGLVAAVTIPVSLITLVASLWFTDALRKAGFDISEFTSPDAVASFGNGDTAAFGALMGQLLGFIVFLLIIIVIAAFIQGVLINGPLTYIASESVLGRKITIGEAFRAAQNRFRALAGGLIVFYLITFMIMVLGAITFFLCGLGFGLVLYILLTLYAFITPVLVLERIGALDGIGRAWALAKARFWPTFGLFVLVTVITYVLGFALNLINNLITRGAISPASFTTAAIAETILQALSTIVIAPILPIGFTLMYYDARIRLEGLDIALQNVETLEPRPSDIASPPPPGETFSRDDLINMGIVSFGTLILGCLLLSILNSLSPFLLQSMR